MTVYRTAGVLLFLAALAIVVSGIIIASLYPTGEGGYQSFSWIAIVAGVVILSISLVTLSIGS